MSLFAHSINTLFPDVAMGAAILVRCIMGDLPGGSCAAADRIAFSATTIAVASNNVTHVTATFFLIDSSFNTFRDKPLCYLKILASEDESIYENDTYVSLNHKSNIS